jgi:hypothetical protein
MRRAAKTSAARALTRKAVARLGVRQTPPAWIDAEQGLAFTAAVTRRVRDGLPLRAMPAKKIVRTPKAPHVRRRR